MTILESLEHKLNQEIEAHRNTKIEFQELKNKYAHLELMTGDKSTLSVIQKLMVEKAALKKQVTELNAKIAYLNGLMLPGVSPTGIHRAYDHRRKT